MDIIPADAIRAPIAHAADSSVVPSVTPSRRRLLLGIWLWGVAALVFAMVLVGGATRLTGSGLSIVEWQPVTGVVPPLSAADWEAAFAQYRAIPQYQRVNRGMSLDEFKTIYWWEWGHRLLGRLIGAVFLLPFVYFLWRGWIDRRLATALAGIFALGAVQGGIGWWMVASGLADRVSVSQYRLAFHLSLACVIYAVLVWTAERTMMLAEWGRGPTSRAIPRRLVLVAAALVALILAQIYLGALVAGLHAGLIYNTWPLIDGSIVPPAKDLLFDAPLWRNFFENTLTVQFDHRMLAYVIAVLAALHAADAWRSGYGAALAGLLAAAVLVQAALGVMALIQAVPVGLALLHQATALVVLTAATLNAARLTSRWQRRPS